MGVNRYYEQISRLEWLDDDNIPHIWPYTGTEIFAEAFGCKVHYPENNMPFALHLIEDYREISKLKVPDPWDTKLSILFDITRKMREKTDKNAVVKLPDIQSPMSVAALILKKELFFVTLIEEPKNIMELAYKVRTLLTQFLDEWFKEFGHELIAHYPNYYLESGVTFSEDEVGSISADMFKQHFIRDIEYLSDRYGNLGMHCCANSRHQWENFNKIKNLKVLNIVLPREIVEEANEYFKDNCVMVRGWVNEDNSSWATRFPDTRMIFNVNAKDRDDALKKLELLRNNAS